MKKYIVKPEYIDLWSNDSEWCEHPVVTDAELRDFANGCDATVEDLLSQVTEIESDEGDPA